MPSEGPSKPLLVKKIFNIFLQFIIIEKVHMVVKKKYVLFEVSLSRCAEVYPPPLEEGIKN